MLSLPHQLLLAAIGEDGLEATGGSERMRYSLAGAMLLELHWLGRISLETEPVAIVDRTPHPDPWVAGVQAAMLRPKHPASTIVWLHALRQLCPEMREQGLATLVDGRVLAEQDKRMLGALPYATYRVLDTVRRQEILRRLERAARGDTDADEPTRALVAFVLACGLESTLFGEDARRLKPGLAGLVVSACDAVKAVEHDVREAADSFEATRRQPLTAIQSPPSDFRPIG